tara:strand:+ start:34994 stop:36313 length:1320 start_codon:yes stop_codon:yes gene_type:complete
MITNFTESDKYRNEIHDLIPGGAHTYSKGDDQFPQLSPAAIVKGEGVYVWDLDGNKYLDCSMGLTSVSLGHAYKPVVDAVKAELDNGVNFQRPSHLEREVAKAFLSEVKCHDMVKFSKNGSTVTTAAVKLARAKTGRKYVAFPSDHPFYSYDDWFIGRTKCSKGVPEENTVLSLTYLHSDLSTLEKLFADYKDQIACVITEPVKNYDPGPEYAKNVMKIAHDNGALFIADEMVSGFKAGFPGAITEFGIEPDMATWGKGIANGFSFCALTGKKDVMSLGGINNEGEEKVFLISTTHGGETHTLAAAKQCLIEYREKNVIAHTKAIGRYFCEKVKNVLTETNMHDYVTLTECEWFPMLVFKNREKEVCMKFRTLLLQEMIRRGVLFQGVLSPSFSHQESDIDFFAEALTSSLKVYATALEEGVEKYLVGKETKPVFRKFN